MAEQILARFEAEISELVLVPAQGGRFEVTRDQDVLFSKAALGRHATIEEVLAALESGQPVTS